MSRISSQFDQRWTVLVILCTGMLMVILDNTIVNVALASIQHDLGFTSANLAWPVNAYMIAFGGVLLLAGRLGDLIGTKRVFMAGLVIFTVSSLLCGLAQSQWTLIAARFVQGIGGAMASSVILAMIFTTFHDSDERAKALSVFSFTASAGGSVGLLLGGVLTQALNWHWIFLVNVPIGIAAYAFAHRTIPNGNGIGLHEGADGLGAALLTASLMIAVYAVVQIPQGGASLQTLFLVLLSAALLAAFVIRQARIARPLLPLRVFATHNITWSNILQALIVSGLGAFFFLYSLYLRGVLHYDAVRTGLAFLPLTIGVGAFSIGPSAWLMRRFGLRAPLVAGLFAAALGLAIFAVASPQAPYGGVIFPGMLLIGVGIGAAFPCVMDFAMTGATQNDSGLLSGLANTFAEVGGALGLALLAATAASRTNAALARGIPLAGALTAGYHYAFTIGTVCLLAGMAVAAFVLQTPGSRGLKTAG